MSWKAAAIKLSDKQKEILESYAKGTHVALNLKIRAQIILKSSNGDSNSRISKDMKINRESVIRWRNRYHQSFDVLRKTELEEARKLKQLIAGILSDNQRPGAPATFTDMQKAEIIALACKNPEELGLPFSHWTPTLLQIEVENKGIVEKNSVSQIKRFLKSTGTEAPSSKIMAKP